MSALRVAMLTPLPPALTGTAEYAKHLISALRKLVRLEVFESVRNLNLRGFDAVIYQIANNPHHSAIYDFALEHPGVAVLHEVNLHDLVKGQTLHQGDEQAYLREVMYEVFGVEVHDPNRGELFDVPQPRTFTMIRRLIDRSLGCIVHSAYAEQSLRQKGFAGPVAVIPHGSAVRSVEVESYRRKIGASLDSPVLGLFGYQRPDKRGFQCLRAFEAVLQLHADARLLVVGQPHPEVPVRQWVQQSGLEKQVHVLGYLSLDDFDGYLAACDIVLNLRAPTFGETSGTMMRAFGLGKTVIVSDTGACRELPDDLCLRVAPDELEAPVLEACINWLLESRSRLDLIGRRAQQWVSETCTWELVAQQYADAAESVAACRNGTWTGKVNAAESAPPAVTVGLQAHTVESYLRRWIDPGSDAANYFRTHSDRLVRTLQLTPSGGKQDRILDMGCYLQVTPALRHLLGYGEVRGCYLGPPGERVKGRAVSNGGEIFECFVDLFDADSDPFPYPNAYFSTVLCCELLEHLENDPMHMVKEIHRILKPGGILVLTTPNIASLRAISQVLRGAHPASFRRYTRTRFNGVFEPGHSREYTPDEICLLLTDAGFIVTLVDTGPYGETDLPDPRWVLPALRMMKMPASLRDDCIYAIGRKESVPRKRFPAWLYGE